MRNFNVAPAGTTAYEDYANLAHGIVTEMSSCPVCLHMISANQVVAVEPHNAGGNGHSQRPIVRCSGCGSVFFGDWGMDA